MKMNNDCDDGDIWEGFEDIVILPKLPEQKRSSILIRQDHVLEVDQDHSPMDCFLSDNEAKEYTIQERQIQFNQDLKQQDFLIHMLENRMPGAGGVSESTSYDGLLSTERSREAEERMLSRAASNRMLEGVDESTCFDGTLPTESNRGVEERKQSRVASKRKRKLTPIEMWADSVLNQDVYGRITLQVTTEKTRTMNVLVGSELSTIADVKRAVRGYMIGAQGDVVEVERILLADSSGVELNDQDTLRELNTTEFKLILLPK